MGEHGLEMKPRGAGLVIGEAGLGLWCKASECGRDLSMKALTDRLGPFERDRNRPTRAHKRYEQRPRQPNPARRAFHRVSAAETSRGCRPQAGLCGDKGRTGA